MKRSRINQNLNHGRPKQERQHRNQRHHHEQQQHWYYKDGKGNSQTLPTISNLPERYMRNISGPYLPVTVRRVAIGFHGEYVRREKMLHVHTEALACSNFFRDSENITDTLIKPLIASNVTVEVFFHSVSRCKEIDRRLIAALKPVRWEFSKRNLPRIVDSFLRVIDMIHEYEKEKLLGENSINFGESEIKSSATYFDFIILTRFDVKFRIASILNLNIDFNGAVNLAFKDAPPYWRKEEKVSDLFFVFPSGTVARNLRKAIDTSAGPHSHHSAAHWIYPYLRKSLIETTPAQQAQNTTTSKAIHFIDPLGQSSNVQVDGKVKSFLYLDRSCANFDQWTSCSIMKEGSTPHASNGNESNAFCIYLLRAVLFMNAQNICRRPTTGFISQIELFDFAEFYGAATVTIFLVLLIAVAVRIIWIQVFYCRLRNQKKRAI